MAAGSLHPKVDGLNTHSRVLLSASSCTCTSGSCHFHRPSCGKPHILRVSTPPYCASPAVIAPFVKVLDGVRKPDSEPANRQRSGGNVAIVSAPVPPCAAPTMPWPVGARPLLAASQSGSS